MNTLIIANNPIYMLKHDIWQLIGCGGVGVVKSITISSQGL